MLRNSLILALFVSLAGFASVASAQTYYDILKGMYQASNEKIDVSDFDVVGDPDAKTCLEVAAEKPDREQLSHVRRFTFIRDGRGPALPQKRYTKIVFASVNEPDMRGTSERVETTYSSTGREIRSKHLAPYNFNLRVRKTAEGYLVFQRTLESKNINYGYCY